MLNCRGWKVHYSAPAAGSNALGGAQAGRLSALGPSALAASGCAPGTGTSAILPGTGWPTTVRSAAAREPRPGRCVSGYLAGTWLLARAMVQVPDRRSRRSGRLVQIEQAALHGVERGQRDEQFGPRRPAIRPLGRPARFQQARRRRDAGRGGGRLRRHLIEPIRHCFVFPPSRDVSSLPEYCLGGMLGTDAGHSTAAAI